MAQNNLPAFISARAILLIVALSILLYFGKSLFVPISYGLFIAIVLYPLARWLELRKWPRSLAITLCLLIIVVLFIAIVSLLVVQINVFKKDLPVLNQKLQPAILSLQQWLYGVFGISISSQKDWWQNMLQSMGDNAGNIAQNVLSITANSLFTLFIIPVYSALFLYNRGTFVQFIEEAAGANTRVEVRKILNEITSTYFNFIKGMVMVYIIVGVLNSLGLMALGIRYAILFGMLTAIMTIIPYIGIFISALLPISVAWITKDSIWYPVGVIAVFGFVQYLEANLIFPKVVATQIKVSTWATLVAMMIGGILWGVSGMILFIPFAGVLKIISDHVPSWKPVNTLLSRS